MRTRHVEGRRHGRNVTAVGVWGLHSWTSGRVWAYHDSNRERPGANPFSGKANWGTGYWVTDHWYRW